MVFGPAGTNVPEEATKALKDLVAQYNVITPSLQSLQGYIKDLEVIINLPCNMKTLDALRRVYSMITQTLHSITVSRKQCSLINRLLSKAPAPDATAQADFIKSVVEDIVQPQIRYYYSTSATPYFKSAQDMIDHSVRKSPAGGQ